MFDTILKAFSSAKQEPLNKDDGQLALAALMVRVARTDGDYAEVEINTIDQTLAAHFNLDTAQAIALRKEAEILEPQAPDNVRFTRVIKDAVDYEDRSSIIEALWTVVVSDGQRDDDENGFMRLITNLLGVNDRDSAFARQRALAKNP